MREFSEIAFLLHIIIIVKNKNIILFFFYIYVFLVVNKDTAKYTTRWLIRSTLELFDVINRVWLVVMMFQHETKTVCFIKKSKKKIKSHIGSSSDLFLTSSFLFFFNFLYLFNLFIFKLKSWESYFVYCFEGKCIDWMVRDFILTEANTV